MALFNPFSLLKNAYSKAEDAVGSVIKTVSAPIVSGVKKVAKAVSSADLTANISSGNRGATLTPKPYLPPTPFGGAGPDGTQPAVVPHKGVPSGPYQNFTPAPNYYNNNITPQEAAQNRSINPNAPSQPINPELNYTPVPNMSTPYGPAQSGNGTQIIYMNRNTGRPGPQPTDLDYLKNLGGDVKEETIGRGLDSYVNYHFQLPTNSPIELANYYSQFGSVTSPTGFYGSGGTSNQSFDQFYNPTGISGIAGGGALLPGSLGSPMRGITIPYAYPNKEDEKKKKNNIVESVENAPGGGGISDLIKNLLGGTANAATMPENFTPNPNAQQQSSSQMPSQQGGNYGLIGKLGGFLGNVLNPKFDISRTESSTSMLPQLDFSTGLSGVLSNAQKDVANYIGSSSKQKTQIPVPTVPSATEVVSGVKSTTPLSKVGTESQFNNEIQNRYTSVIANQQQVDAKYKESLRQNATEQALQTALNKSGGYIKAPDAATGQINVLKVNADGTTSWVSPTEFQQAGLNIDTIPDAQQFGNELNSNVNSLLNKVIDTKTGLPFKQEDFEFDEVNDSRDEEMRAQMELLKNQIAELQEKDPFAGKTFLEMQEQFMKDEGVASDKALRDKKQEELDLVLKTYEGIATEIKDDPDFAKTLKSRRLEYVTNKQADAARILQRDIDRLTTRISDGQEKVAKKLDAAYKDYLIFKDKRDSLNSTYEKLLSNMDKASDNARAAINSLMSNPSLAANLTDAEIQFIYKNGTFPASLVKKIGTAVGTELKSTFNEIDAAGRLHTYGITKDNKRIEIGAPISGFKVAGGGSGTSNPVNLEKDINSALSAIAQVQNDPGLNVTEKNSKINAIISRVQIAYMGDSSAASIINSRFGSASTVNTQNVGSTVSQTEAEFGKDLASELALVQSRWVGKSGTAKEAQNRLINKYGKDFEARIQSQFKPYIN